MCARYFYLARFVFFKKFLIIPENYAVIYRIKASNYLFKVMKHFVCYRETPCFKPMNTLFQVLETNGNYRQQEGIAK
jgi:hypothetical protein